MARALFFKHFRGVLIARQNEFKYFGVASFSCKLDRPHLLIVSNLAFNVEIGAIQSQLLENAQIIESDGKEHGCYPVFTFLFVYVDLLFPLHSLVKLTVELFLDFWLLSHY